MGVPAFFRWLSRKYPSVVSHCVELNPVDDNGVPTAVDPSEPNPNGVEFDNLYLDMNGIIHPCTHPEDKPAPKNEDEMMVAIFECIDRLLNIVRPRKLLYMAVDGVAPRAKMNQQRSRRFRAAKESTEKRDEIAKIRAKLEEQGAILPPLKSDEEHFDSNCITPGTPFMARLSKCLHYYAHNRLNKHPAWKHLKIILSDANVPGEGEHKIMDFIRKQRSQPDHDPNTKHCLCGADADLIMLGLATHEPYFTIIREEFRPNQQKPCDICGKIGHELKECTGLDDGTKEKVTTTFATETPFIFVRLNVLREYLRRDLDMQGLPFSYDFERVIDDWVFMCFFVGNDFLPHLPSLEIREGAIDRLIGLYKKCVYKTGGYLTDSGDVNMDRVQLIMSDLGVMEDEIFKKRQQTELGFQARNKARKKRMKLEKAREQAREQSARVLSGQYAPVALGGKVSAMVNPRAEIYQQRVQQMHTGVNGVNFDQGDTKRKAGEAEIDSDEEEPVHDEVRLWEAGFKDRYYKSKFDVDPDDIEFRHRVAFEYTKGLCWVLKYYYQGCPSWNWYFPFHYAPFASDFVNIAEAPIIFETGTKPFKPLEQLMGVFPPASKSHIPAPWARLMTEMDSPIIDFYPIDFPIDLNGKKYAWQGVALLPFVDEKRLFKALEPYYELLTEEEKARNCLGDDRLYVTEWNSHYTFLKGLYEAGKGADDDSEAALLFEGISCRVLAAPDFIRHGGSLVAPVAGLEVIYDNKVLCVRYRDPKYLEGHKFPATKLEGADTPLPVLKPQDLSRDESARYRPQIGMARSNQLATLDISAHRALGFHVPKSLEHEARRNPGPYSSMAPPVHSSGGHRGYQSRSDGRRFSSQEYGERNRDRERDRDNGQRKMSRFASERAATNHGYHTGERYHPYQQPASDWYQPYQQQSSYSGSYPDSEYSPQNSDRRYQPYQPRQQTGGPRPPSYYGSRADSRGRW